MDKNDASWCARPFKVVSVFFSLIVAGCGGGGGGGPAGGDNTQTAGGSNGPITLQGVVASGKPLAGYSVEVTSLGGISQSGELTTTDAQGRYSITLSSWMQPPFAIAARKYPVGSTYPHLLSFSERGGTANVTPLTSLLVTQLLQSPVFPHGLNYEDYPKLLSVTESQIVAARQKVVDYLLTRPAKYDGSVADRINASGIADFVKTPFQPIPGDPYDDVLEALNQSLIPSENLLGIKERMLNNNAALPDLSQIERMIYCYGNVCGAPKENTIALVPGTPRVHKYSLFKQVTVQLLRSPLSSIMDCGPAPAIHGFRPGNNTVLLDGATLKINSPLTGDATLYDLASLSEISIDVGQHIGTAEKYFTGFGGAYGVAGYETARIGLSFDSNGYVSGVGVSEKQADTWKQVSCTVKPVP